jgi:hypothetical protein
VESTPAQSLPKADRAEDVGISSERLKRVTSTFQAQVDNGVIPGAVILIAHRGKIAYVEALGFRDRETQAPMQRDSIFRIASMTKPFTSVASARASVSASRCEQIKGAARCPALWAILLGRRKRHLLLGRCCGLDVANGERPTDTLPLSPARTRLPSRDRVTIHRGPAERSTTRRQFAHRYAPGPF